MKHQMSLINIFVKAVYKDAGRKGHTLATGLSGLLILAVLFWAGWQSVNAQSNSDNVPTDADSAVVTPEACVTPPPNMVAWFPGDGNAHDISGSNNYGSVGTQTAFSTGEVAQGFQFNGSTSSNVSVPDSPSLHPTTAMTLDAWINPASGNGSFESIVYKGNLGTFAQQPYALFLTSGGQLNLRLGNASTVDSLSSVAALPINTFTHVAFTYDGTTIAFYINGVLDSSKTTTIGTLNQTETNPLIIGSDFGGFIGGIDELEIFNRPLSQGEIQSIVNAGSFGKCKPIVPPAGTACTAPPANMVGWLPGDVNGDDVTGNGNNGTVGSQTSFAAGKVLQGFLFNGNNAGDVIVNDSASLRATNALTLDAWINPTQAGDIMFKGCFGSGNCQPYGLLFTAFTATGGHAILSIGNETTFDRLATGSAVPFNTLTHITGTYDGTTMRIYVNGLLDNAKPTAIGTLNQSNTLPLLIGDGPVGPFTGVIDEVEIFTRKLSDTEVYNIYNAGSFGKCKPPTVNGSVTYANAISAPTPRFISNVTVTGTGSPNVMTTTGGLANRRQVCAVRIWSGIVHRHPCQDGRPERCYQFE